MPVTLQQGKQLVIALAANNNLPRTPFQSGCFPLKVQETLSQNSSIVAAQVPYFTQITAF